MISPLPVLLSVEAFVLYLPALSSYPCCLFRVLFGDIDARWPSEICPHALPVLDFFFLKPQHIQQLPIVIDIVDKLGMPLCPLFQNLLIFQRNARDAPRLITDDEFPAIIPAVSITGSDAYRLSASSMMVRLLKTFVPLS